MAQVHNQLILLFQQYALLLQVGGQLVAQIENLNPEDCQKEGRKQHAEQSG
jgi:hypothetical protein